MPMYNLIEYSNDYLKTSESLWSFYRDETGEADNAAKTFKSKVNIIRKTPDNDNAKDVKIAVPLKYLSNFQRTLEMPLINCEINLN